MLIEKQPDHGCEIECDLPELTIVREPIDGNVEGGDDLRDVIVHRTELLSLRSKIINELCTVAVLPG